MNESTIETEICGLCRFSLKEEHLVQAHLVKSEITRSFEEKRSFPFRADAGVVDALKAGSPIGNFKSRFITIKNDVFDEVAAGDSSIRARLSNDARLSERIVNAIYFVHKALAEGTFTTMKDRRFVVIKERPGKPTIYHVSNDTTVISHIGQGPYWAEIPTVYLGLKTFDALESEEKKNGVEMLNAFKKLLSVEERAIETGYIHIETYSPDFSRALNLLVDTVIAYSYQTEAELIAEPEKKEEKNIHFKNP